jgi:fanconi-associated nuclease 1
VFDIEYSSMAKYDRIDGERPTSPPSAMALQTRSPSAHNRMVGTKIRHPPSTNFDSKDFPIPRAKRVKWLESDRTDSNLSEDEQSQELSHSPSRNLQTEIADSEDDDADGGVPLPGSQTALETALPPIRTDKEAIAEYDAYKAGEAAELSLQGRLDNRSWTRGKSSIYVDAFNLALETVLDEEAHLFDEAEKALFAYWQGLAYESQYLYVRLFLRKTSAWHRVNKLGYHSDIANLEASVADLQLERALPIASTEEQVSPGELEPPEGTVLVERFTFAECSEQHINTLNEASSLLLLDELKNIAKEAKVRGKNKKELLMALQKTSGKQSALGFRGLRRSDTEDSVASNGVESEEDGGDGAETPSHKTNRDAHYTRKILDHTGKCIRLSLAPLKLFERVHLVFYRSTEWTEKSLTTIILAKISRRNFPPYIVSRSSTIFATRALLREFEASLRVQFKIDSILEFNGTPGRGGLEQVKAIFEEVYPRWKVLLAEEQAKEDRVYESGEGAYLRRFSPAWVYTRIVHKGLHPLARFKEHLREHEILTELLGQRLFHAARRGSWYQRKALLEEHYMHALTDPDGRTEEAQKKHWKRIALRTGEEGLEDRECHLIYHYDLQKRIKKLEKSLKIPVRQQHDFGHSSLVKPLERTVEGIRVEREPSPPKYGGPGDGPRNSETTRRGAKTIWLDSHESGGECSVEAMCLSHYRSLGWKGYHSEGGIVRTLFAFLFYDILFTYVPNVFQTAFQTCPLDLFTDAFYSTRISEINARLAQISNGAAKCIFRGVWDEHVERRTCVVGLSWEYEFEDLSEIIDCFGGEELATLCKVMAQEYQQRGGGIPDLFLWRVVDDGGRNGRKGEVMFSEVKSENDRLSDTQRLWIHVLTGAGIRVELCHAKASEVRLQNNT